MKPIVSDEALAARQFRLLIGPPGVGKTLWAKQFSGEQRLFPFTVGQSEIYRMAGLEMRREPGLMRDQAIFRAPHHTVSLAGMTGKIRYGWFPMPGEFSLAHGGTLLLDEANEFPQRVLAEVLAVVKTGTVTLREGGGPYSLPACFSLVLAMQPCPCGYHGVSRAVGLECQCSAERVKRHQGRIRELFPFCEVVRLERGWEKSEIKTSLAEQLNETFSHVPLSVRPVFCKRCGGNSIDDEGDCRECGHTQARPPR